jgi:hypothetical protein
MTAWVEGSSDWVRGWASRFRPRAVVMDADEVGEDLGVGGGLERVALGGELAFEDFEVLDDPVVDEGDTSRSDRSAGVSFRRRAGRGWPSGCGRCRGSPSRGWAWSRRARPSSILPLRLRSWKALSAGCRCRRCRSRDTRGGADLRG